MGDRSKLRWVVRAPILTRCVMEVRHERRVVHARLV